MAGAGLGTLDSAVMLMRDPVQSWDAVVEFAGSDEAQALLGKAVGAAFKSQIDQIGQALTEGGDANAENLGRQMGQAVALVVQLLAGGGSSSANSALTLSRLGIDVSVDTVKKIGASFDLDLVKSQINKLQTVVRDTDVPVLDSKPPATGGLTDSEAGFSTLPKIGSLLGEAELPPKNASIEMVRSIKRQNEAAKALAKAGYDVEQLPNVAKNRANPDLKINGEVADVASPQTGSLLSVWKTINDKVIKQAKTVVLNLVDSPLGFDDIQKNIAEYPVKDLKKLYLLKDGQFRVIEVHKP